MPEEQLINKIKELRKKHKDLDVKVTAKERKLQCVQRGSQNKKELEEELNKELDELKKQRDGIQKEISYLQKLVHLQGKTEMNEKKVQELQDQIKDLEKKNEIIGELDKEIKELKAKKDELERKITQLRSKIQDLNKQIEDRDNRVLLLKNEMNVNDINHQNRIKDITAKHERKIKDLHLQTKKQEDNHSKKMDELFDSNKFLQLEVLDLKTENSKIKNDLNMLKKTGTSTCQDDNQYILYIGQVCSDLQTNWYRHVMPEYCFKEGRSYKVKDIEEDLDDPDLFHSEEEQTEAKKRWEQLQKNVIWKKNKRLLKAIKRLQFKRNEAAHPTVTEEGARKALEELEKQGELKVKPSSEDVRKLIELWKSSNAL